MMHHLTSESLARLVDEPPDAIEREHLQSCAECRESLESMCRDRLALAGLPVHPHPASAWTPIEARLEAEGLFASAPASSHAPLANARLAHARLAHASPTRRKLPGWLQAAAGIVLFAAGWGAGAGWLGAGGKPAQPGEARMADGPSAPLTLDDAEELVNLTQQWHLDALAIYRARLDGADGIPEAIDPVLRFLLLDDLFAAAEFAVRESPADPFLNGLFVSTAAERQVALDEIAWAIESR